MIEWLLTSLWWMYHDMKSEWPGIFIKDHIQIGIYRGATIFGSFAGSFSGPKIISLSEVFFSAFKFDLLELQIFRGTWRSCLKEAIGFWGSELLKDKVYMTLSCVCGLWEEMRFCQDHFRNHQSILLLLSLKTLWKRQKWKDPQLIYYHRKSLTHSLTNSLPITTF